VLALGRHTGPFLWQLPPRLRFERARVERFLSALPPSSGSAERLARRHDRRLPSRARLYAAAESSYRHAFEVRDMSFVTPEFAALLRDHNAAFVLSDTGGRYPLVEELTADFVYVRLHGPRELYASAYSAHEISEWARRVGRWRDEGRDVYVYFDNDAFGHAPRDAAALQAALGLGPPGEEGTGLAFAPAGEPARSDPAGPPRHEPRAARDRATPAAEARRSVPNQGLRPRGPGAGGPR
jgi:uncharacterized protein YecE (DUF72 family)